MARTNTIKTRPLGIKTHGLSRTRLYRQWVNVLARCYNPEDINYKNYGARGIRTTKHWLKFENFLKDMGMPSSEDLTIDRINNDKNYSKSNCRWATKKENTRNKRNNRYVTYNGKTQAIVAWAEELGIGRKVLVERLNLGWSIKKAFNTPTRKWLRKSKL